MTDYSKNPRRTPNPHKVYLSPGVEIIKFRPLRESVAANNRFEPCPLEPEGCTCPMYARWEVKR